MIVTREDLERFHHFAISQLPGERSGLTWRQLFELWRFENPSPGEENENVAAIQQSLDAMDAGCVRPFSVFDSNFRQRHDIMDDA